MRAPIIHALILIGGISAMLSTSKASGRHPANTAPRTCEQLLPTEALRAVCNYYIAEDTVPQPVPVEIHSIEPRFHITAVRN